MTFLTAMIVVISALTAGFTLGVLYLEMTTVSELKKQLRRSRKLTQSAIDLALTNLERDDVPKTEKGEKMVLSPIQVRRFGQPE